MNGSNRFVTLKVLVFMLVIVALFTYYANSIPQLESQPPKELTLSKEGLTPEALVEAGKEIFYGKGTCALCHGIGEKGARAPDLGNVGALAATRMPGKSAKEYLIESLVDPAAYVVEGYPPIMPVVNKPPIALNPTEVLAVVAFLESLGGTVDVKPEDIPSEAADTTATVAAPPPVKFPGNPETGKEVAQACVQCHVIEGVGKPRRPRAPDLSAIGAIATPDYIIESILNPDAVVVAGYRAGLMPKDFGEKLTAQEFMDLMAFLTNLKGGPAPGSEEGKEDKPTEAETEKKSATEEIKTQSDDGTSQETQVSVTTDPDAKPAEEKKEETQESQPPAAMGTDVKPAEEEKKENSEGQSNTGATNTGESQPQQGEAPIGEEKN